MAISEGLPYSTLTYGPYEVCSPKSTIARAVNKCQWCKGRIEKGISYLSVMFLDRSGRKFHRRLKFCTHCIGHVHDLKTHGNITVRDNLQDRMKNILRSNLRRDRYNILLRKDSWEEYFKIVRERDEKGNDSGIVQNCGFQAGQGQMSKVR